MGFGPVVENVPDDGDFIDFLGARAELSQDEQGIGRLGAQGTEGLNPLALVMGAARRLAVNGGQIVRVWP
jgi:hypothetical protein